MKPCWWQCWCHHSSHITLFLCDHQEHSIYKCDITKATVLLIQCRWAPTTPNVNSHLTMIMYTSIVQMGGWGKRSPFSKTEEISLAGIPSYGLDPNVISSQTVTPAGWDQKKDRQKGFAGSWSAWPGCREVMSGEGFSRGITRAPSRKTILGLWEYLAFFFFLSSQLVSQKNFQKPSQPHRKEMQVTASWLQPSKWF